MPRLKLKTTAKSLKGSKLTTSPNKAKQWYKRWIKKNGESPAVTNAAHGTKNDVKQLLHKQYLAGKVAKASKLKATSRQDIVDKASTKKFVKTYESKLKASIAKDQETLIKARSLGNQ